MRAMKPDNWRSNSILFPCFRLRAIESDAREYDRAMYKRRNQIERLFRRLKGFRRIFSRFEKLDVIFIGFIVFALIVDGLR